MTPQARRRALGLVAAGLIALALAIVLLLPPPGQGTATGPVPLDYVGVRSCQGCHPEEVESWRGSHHDLAIQRPDAKTVLGDFGSRSFVHQGATTRFSQARRRLRRAHRRAGRARGRLQGRVRVRRDAARAVPARAARGAAAGARRRVGQPAGARRRPALLPPLPGRDGRPRRRPALDATLAELEQPVRGVPLDQPAQGLRGGAGPLRNDLLGAERRLRGVPRPGVAARGVGAGGQGRPGARPKGIPAWSCASTSARSAARRWTPRPAP